MANLLYQHIITFTKTGDTMAAYDKGKAVFADDLVLIPVPNLISKSCGLALEFTPGLAPAQKDFFAGLTVKAYLYVLTLHEEAIGNLVAVSAEEVGQIN